MASLTPLSKTLIGLAVVGAMASAAWHLALKEMFGQGQAAAPVASVAPPPAVVVPAEPPPPPPVPSPTANRAMGDDAALAPPPPPVAEVRRPEPELSPAEHTAAGRKLLLSGDHAQARAHLEAAVQGGDGAAACLLGEMNMKGQGGLAVDQDKAASLFQFAQSKNIICFASGQ